MSELFTIPETPPDRLAVARKEYDAALAAYEDAISIDPAHATADDQSKAEEARDRAAAARYELSAAELERLRKFDI